jgi:hypothetical protein
MHEEFILQDCYILIVLLPFIIVWSSGEVVHFVIFAWFVD